MAAQLTEHLVLTQATARGNRVRVALLRAHQEGLEAGLSELVPLLAALGQALGLSPAEEAQLSVLLPSLLAEASASPHGGEARALFDLQSLCLDEQREEPYDLVGWLRSGGARRADRARPYMHQLRRLRHLKRAVRRMYASHAVGDDVLAAALEPAAARLEADLIAVLHPQIVTILAESGLQPPPGQAAAAYGALADTLLARAISEGVADFGDLRDAISRLPAKIPDLTVAQLRQRDALLYADARLDVVLDGVYWRGELYLRLLHRLQSMIFGTPAGRLAARFFIAPLGIAVIALSFSEYVAEHVVGPVSLVTAPLLLGLGLVAGLLLNLPAWRSALVAPARRGLLRLLAVLGHHSDHDTPAAPQVDGLRGAVAALVRWYRWAVDRFDAALYRADEWIRFRGGDRRGARQAEGLALLLSFLLGYTLRLAFRLVLEPMLNPIKHFPVVTVAGKLALASGLPVLLTQSLSMTLPVGLAGTLAFLISLVFIPGLSGFLIWEISYNWRLYLANTLAQPADRSTRSGPGCSPQASTPAGSASP